MEAVQVLEAAVEAEKVAQAVPIHFDGRHLSGTGQLFITIGLVCMAVSTAYFYMKAMSKKGDAQFFEGLTCMITGIATVAYLTMFSNAGKMAVHGRALFYVRYIDWILTTPLMLWDILALAGASSSEIMLAAGIDMLMIGFGVVGAATASSKKWVFWAFGMLCFFHVVGVLMKYMGKDTYGPAARKLYGQVAWLTIVLWTFYPIVWILCEGAHMFEPTIEAGLYMVLDVLAKCMFGFIIVGSRSALDAVAVKADSDETQGLLRNQAA